MVVGQMAGVTFDYTIKDSNTGAPRTGIDIIIAIYTFPKGDGTDIFPFFYNSKLVYGSVNSNQIYLLSDTTTSQISSSYSSQDPIFISIGSDSAEDDVEWVFTLISGTVYTTGPVGN